MALPENTQGWIDRYEKRYKRAYDNYQQTGEARYDSQSYEYQCIVSAFEALQKREDERDHELMRRRTNMNSAVDRLYKDEYTERDIPLIDMALEALHREEAEEKGYCHRIRPKADRPKGEWIEHKDCEGKARTITCSRCGYKERSWVNMHYCPNCGAKMKGGDDE